MDILLVRINEEAFVGADDWKGELVVEESVE